MLPSFATNANITTNAGVEQGDEKNPPNIPAINAPMNVTFLYLGY